MLPGELRWSQALKPRPTGPAPKMLVKILGLLRRKNSGTDITQWMSDTRGKAYGSGSTFLRCERGRAQERAVGLRVWVSIFYWQVLTRGQSIHYLGEGFLGSRISGLFFLIWPGVGCWGTCHLRPVWLDLASCGVRSGHASDLPIAGHNLLFAGFQVSR